MSDSITCNVLVEYEQDTDLWFAICLEMDICGESDTEVGAVKLVRELCMSSLEYAWKHDNMNNLFSGAPLRLWYDRLKCNVKHVIAIPFPPNEWGSDESLWLSRRSMEKNRRW